MNKFALLLLIFVTTTNANIRKKRIVGGEPASIPPTESTDTDGDSVVFVYENDRSAKVKGSRYSGGYHAFRGIRYAEPPVEALRFQRPVFLYMEGDVSAEKYGSPCLQPNDANGTVGSEDCLYLNVYTPLINLKQNDSGLPVLFWIHGGGFRRGSAAQYGVSGLVSKQLVIVTVQYRLGSLGWLGASSKQMPGNAALFDVRAALEWTRRYISFFGGDPDKIYTSGQGVGASMALMLSHSFFTSHIVRGVFAMSGTAVSANAVDYMPLNTSSSLATANHCYGRRPLEIVRCLQEMDTERILSADNYLQSIRLSKEGFVSALTQLLSAGPVIEGCDDGRFLSFFLNDPPLDSLKHKPRRIPLLIGVTKHETSKPILGRFRNDVLQRIATIPDFIDRYLPLTLLNNNIGLFTNGTVNRLLLGLFSNNDYLNLITATLTPGLSDLEKAIEMTTDALFNLPAVTTSALWNKRGAQAYFYSFEHISANPQLQSIASQYLLDGLPQGSQTPSTAAGQGVDRPTVGHGDDLVYLFDLQTLEGQPLPEAILTDSRDVQLKEIFTNLLSEFLHSGKPRVPELNQEWPPYEETRAEYVALTNRPRVVTGFRLCQMALWGGFVDTLRSTLCNLPGIDGILNSVSHLLDEGLLNNAHSLASRLGLQGRTEVVGGITGVLTGNKSGKVVDGVGGALGSGGLLGGRQSSASLAPVRTTPGRTSSTKHTTASSTKHTTSRSEILPLGGLLG